MYTKQEIQKYKNQLSKLVKENPFSYFILLKKQTYKDLLKFINENTPKLNNSLYKLSTKINWILNDIHDFPICPICKKQFGIGLNLSLNKQYNNTCSTKCGATIGKDKAKQTCLKKYGVDNVAKSNIIKEKTKIFMLQKYGVQHVNQYNNAQFNTKFTQTCLKKYGVDNPLKSDIVRNKIIQTNLKKYGVDNPVKANIIQEKIKQSNLEKYGVTNPNKLDSTKNKIKNTCLKKYGVDNVAKSNIVKNKIKNTCIEKYGQASPMFVKKFKDKNKYTKAINRYNAFLNSEAKPQFNFDLYLNNKNNLFFEYQWKCTKCNHIFKSSINENWYKLTNNFARCLHCYPYLNCGTSNEELKLLEFIKSLTTEQIKSNIRNIINPLELDIYIPSKKLAFEFDGLYFHSEANCKNNNYHLIKTEKCLNQNIQLIHIFENEWLYKNDIVQSRIKNLFGIYNKVIYARKCQIKQISSKESEVFLNKNHLQGSIKSKINIGLFYDNQLISLMTFGKSRYNKNYEYELLRFCNSLGYHIPGAASKLLSYFQKKYNPKSIISYADRRWSNGNVYEKLGFTLSHKSNPDYWYWKNSEFSHRSKYQKHKLKNIQGFIFDPNLSQAKNMYLNGYNRIFDCGNLVYIKNYFNSNTILPQSNI